MSFNQELIQHKLGEGHSLFECMLPRELVLTEVQFQALWKTHPKNYTEIMMHGRPVLTPRWQQAYGRDYRYTGQVSQALPIPPLLQRILEWVERFDKRLNGLLLNWYDAELGHYIGKHRDSTSGLLNGSPIVIVSFGEERVFRMRPHKGRGMIDLAASHGTVFIIPWETNLAWTHEVPKSTRYKSKRISVTMRAFIDA